MSDDSSAQDFDDAVIDAMDVMSMDVEGDGYAETTLVDFEGDGLADAVVYDDLYTGVTSVSADLDGDGYMETYAEDADYDGVMDTVIVDTNADGYADFEQYGETPFEGTTDTFEQNAEVSFSNEDGLSDDELVEDITESIEDPEDTTDEVDVDPFGLEDGTTSEETDAIHGEPMADMEYHQVQPGDYDCLPTSSAMIISEVTGTDVSAQTVVDTANDLGLMTDTGMYPADAPQLFEAFGIEAEVSTGTMDDLRTALDNDTEVIIALDSDDLYGYGDAPFADDTISGHAVCITGIDDEAGLVYINDPGFADSAGVAIPIDQFEDAWVDMGNQMISVEAPDGAAGSAIGEAAAEQIDTGDDKGVLDYLLLPLSFVVES